MSSPTRPTARVVERRQFGRRTVFKPAQIVRRNGAPIRCYVVDMGDLGAALRICGREAPPDTFELLIEGDDLVVGCQVIHQANGIVGVGFVCSPRIASRRNTATARQAREALSGAMGPAADRRERD